MGNDYPHETLIFAISLIIIGLALKGIFKPKPKPHQFAEILTALADTELKEESVTTCAVYDNAEANELLNAKMEVLKLALDHHSKIGNYSDPKEVTATAREFWNFIALKPDGDSDE